MNVVEPRWEWRTFGDRFTDVEALVAASAPTLRVSHETYIVCNGSDVNTKIRDGQVDVKVLLRVERGLELWSPVLKVPFPIGAGVIRRLFAECGLLSPALARDQYTQVEFLSEVIALTPPCHIIDVEKQRRGAALFGCTVEAAMLRAGDRRIATVAVEATNPNHVLDAVRALALTDHENVSYVKALKRIAAGALAGGRST
ncbi:MAG: hypothetical protein AB7N29_03395 [Vicinamibacterales bacterium]